jgi:hypothetical protein
MHTGFSGLKGFFDCERNADATSAYFPESKDFRSLVDVQRAQKNVDLYPDARTTARISPFSSRPKKVQVDK